MPKTSASARRRAWWLSRAVTLLGIVALNGCIEASRDGAGGVDGREEDAGPRPSGSACVPGEVCEGACVVEGDSPQTGRCAPPCGAGGACPPEQRCAADVLGRSGCIGASRVRDADQACDDGAPCAAGLVCSGAVEGDPGDGSAVCRAPCDVAPGERDPCPQGSRCAPVGVIPRVCLPADSVAFDCPQRPCGRPDLLCVAGDDGRSRCLATCNDEGLDCPGGGRCTRRDRDGVLLCAPTGEGGVGSPCTSGGDAACTSALICLSEIPGDPSAVCSQPCASPSDCCAECEDLACRPSAPGGEAFCVPAPFGVGDGAGAEGADCAAHGDTDCRPGLSCVNGVAGARTCAARCDGGRVCAGGRLCVLRESGARVCLPGDAGGAVGTPCPTGEGCADRCRVELRPDARYCTTACVESGCPGGFHCREGLCAAGAEPVGELGSGCGVGGAVGCASGLCAIHPETVEPVCTQPCDPPECPAGFECVTASEMRLCFRGP